MTTTRKDFYVGTDKHRWWKEAVVYQVSSAGVTNVWSAIDTYRSTQLHFLTPMAMDGVTFQA
jgi:hypothetical protein